MKLLFEILALLLYHQVVIGQQVNEPLFTIDKDSIKCNYKYIEPFYWDYQNESYSLEKSCSVSSRDKKYNYTITLSDYDIARGDGGCFRIIDIKMGNKSLLQLNQSDGWDKIPEGLRNLSYQGYFIMETLSDSVTVLVFRGFLYNSEPELLTIVVLNKGTAKLVFNKHFIFGELEKTNGKFSMMLQDNIIEYVGDKATNTTNVYRIWKENGVLRFGGPYGTMDRNVSPRQNS